MAERHVGGPECSGVWVSGTLALTTNIAHVKVQETYGYHPRPNLRHSLLYISLPTDCLKDAYVQKLLYIEYNMRTYYTNNSE